MCGPYFRDIDVDENCNTIPNSQTADFGTSYANDTGLRGITFFTRLPNFTVKEIEIFEITE
jgi:hypothetical protein